MSLEFYMESCSSIWFACFFFIIISKTYTLCFGAAFARVIIQDTVSYGCTNESYQTCLCFSCNVYT
jgi:hypothetical protein